MWHSETTSTSPWRGVWLLLGTITATELVMLNIIFWARAQGSVAGLVLAVAWPWVAALIAPTLWSSGRRWLGSRTQPRWTLYPRLSLGIGTALASFALFGHLVSIA
jgi:hypothetical protein